MYNTQVGYSAGNYGPALNVSTSSPGYGGSSYTVDDQLSALLKQRMMQKLQQRPQQPMRPAPAASAPSNPNVLRSGDWREEEAKNLLLRKANAPEPEAWYKHNPFTNQMQMVMPGTPGAVRGGAGSLPKGDLDLFDQVAAIGQRGTGFGAARPSESSLRRNQEIEDAELAARKDAQDEQERNSRPTGVMLSGLGKS